MYDFKYSGKYKQIIKNLNKLRQFKKLFFFKSDQRIYIQFNEVLKMYFETSTRTNNSIRCVGYVIFFLH